MRIEIDTDKSRLDVDWVHHTIADTYWAQGMSLETMQICIDHSLNFGVYLAGVQIGYARMVTDYARFAYLMDVIIATEQRGKGYGQQLMQYVLNCPELKQVKTIRLATTDAHGLYAQFGFKPLKWPEKFMELIR